MLSRLWAVKEGERVVVVRVGECYYVGTSAVPGSGVLMLIAARCSRANIHSGEQGECGGDNDGDWHWQYGRFEFRCQRVWDCMKLNGTSSRGKCGELDATGGWGSYITSRSLVMDERGTQALALQPALTRLALPARWPGLADPSSQKS